MDYEFHIPINIDVDALLPENLKGEDRKKYHDRIVYLLQLILSRLKNKKIFERYLNEGVVRLMAKYLRDVMGGQKQSIINLLQEQGIITVDTDYLIGEYSMGYMLTDAYLGQPTKIVSFNSYLVNKIYRKIQTEQRQEQRKLSLKIPKVLAQLDKDWSIEYASAIKWIDIFQDVLYKEINESITIPYNKKDEVITKYNHYYKYVKSDIARIRDKDIKDFIVDNKAGRLHTIFTGLPRPLKNFITIDGEKLVNIDIKNSQPFLLGYTATQRFWKTTQEYAQVERNREEITLAKVGREIHKQIMESGRLCRERTAIIKMLKIAETVDNTASPEINLQCLLQSGKFYEYILDKFNGQFFVEGTTLDRFADRNATKQEVMRIMYFDTRKKNVPFYAPFLLFAQLFPLEARIMTLIKSCGYKQFPVLLQKIESLLMLQKVGENMPNNVPFLTIHDSLIIPENKAQAAAALIGEKFKFYLDMQPMLSDPELLSPQKGFDALVDYVHEKLNKLEIRLASNQPITKENIGADELDDE